MTEFCDNCGEEVALWLPFTSLPADVASACKGESAVLCVACAAEVHNNNRTEGVTK